MKEIPEHIREIILKHLHGTESPQEGAVLNAWRNEDPAQDEEYREFLEIWKESGTLLEAPQFDSTRGWNTIHEQFNGNLTVHQPLTQIKPGKYKLIMNIAIAATLAGVFAFCGWWLLTRNNPDRDLQIVSALTDNKLLNLPDGSLVRLRKGSMLAFPATFSKKERNVQLTGQAFFDVKPDRDHPFRIMTGKTVIEVKGTSFLVNAGAQADRVVVASGKVMVSAKNDLSRSCLLQAQQEASFNGSQFEQRAVTDSNYLAWHTHQLSFDNVSLTQVVADLSDYYEVPVMLDHSQPTIENLLVVGHFDQQPLESVLDEIITFTGLKYRKEKEGFVLYKP